MLGAYKWPATFRETWFYWEPGSSFIQIQNICNIWAYGYWYWGSGSYNKCGIMLFKSSHWSTYTDRPIKFFRYNLTVTWQVFKQAVSLVVCGLRACKEVKYLAKAKDVVKYILARRETQHLLWSTSALCIKLNLNAVPLTDFELKKPPSTPSAAAAAAAAGKPITMAQSSSAAVVSSSTLRRLKSLTRWN